MNDSEKLGLQAEIHLANLVEKQRAPFGYLKAAGVAFERTGKSALGVSEDLALHQFMGDGGAVDRDERFFGAGARLVHRAGDQLLAGAALAGDEHVAVGVGDALDDGQHFENSRCRAQHVRRKAGTPTLASVRCGSGTAGGAFDGGDDRGSLKRLGDKIDGASTHRVDCRGHGHLTGDDDHRQGASVFQRVLHDLEAIDLRHRQVDEQDIVDRGVELFDSFASAARNIDAVATRLQATTQ